jgi:hypothetical protein
MCDWKRKKRKNRDNLYESGVRRRCVVVVRFSKRRGWWPVEDSDEAVAERRLKRISDKLAPISFSNNMISWTNINASESSTHGHSYTKLFVESAAWPSEATEMIFLAEHEAW